MISCIELKSVYSNLWKCRDLEIEMLWKRLTLLGAFMALTYTGYGVLLINGMDGVGYWGIYNLLAMGTCAFGFLFSVLWTATAKGSKAWFERYEAALVYFQKTYQELRLFEQLADEDMVLSYLDFGKRHIRRLSQPVDGNLLSQSAGAYSVSRIPIVMGQLSMVAWCCLSVAHIGLIILGKEAIKRLADGNVVCTLLGVALFVSMIGVSSFVCKRIKSSFFTGKE